MCTQSVRLTGEVGILGNALIETLGPEVTQDFQVVVGGGGVWLTLVELFD